VTGKFAEVEEAGRIRNTAQSKRHAAVSHAPALTTRGLDIGLYVLYSDLESKRPVDMPFGYVY